MRAVSVPHSGAATSTCNGLELGHIPVRIDRRRTPTGTISRISRPLGESLVGSNPTLSATRPAMAGHRSGSGSDRVVHPLERPGLLEPASDGAVEHGIEMRVRRADP